MSSTATDNPSNSKDCLPTDIPGMSCLNPKGYIEYFPQIWDIPETSPYIHPTIPYYKVSQDTWDIPRTSLLYTPSNPLLQSIPGYLGHT